VLLPEPPDGRLVLPVWNGNAFFHADGRRPLIRTLTPLRHDPVGDELDLEVVIHAEGPLSQWAGACRPGDRVALSGPGRGYTIAGGATTFLLAGDESAIPALGQLVDALPPPARAAVVVEIAHPEARLPLTDKPSVELRWVDRPAGAPPGDALVAAVAESEIDPATRVWAAGEAAAMQRIRRHLFEVVGLRRSEATVRGYWKDGRSSSGEDDA
jgi:NADPH-dependent ferric siderophore reductase